MAELDTKRDTGLSSYLRLRELIATGRLAPGAPLIEADLSKRLGVSRTPVRAALQRLQQEGFAAQSPVGETLRPIVSPLTSDDLCEVFLMVGALEASAAHAAASLERSAREALACELEQVNAGLRAATDARPPDLASAHALHARFHRLLAGAAAGPRLRGELDVLLPQAERYARAYAPATWYALEETLHEQGAIVAALRAGDGDAAEQHVAGSWRRSVDHYRRVIAMVGEQGTW